MLPPNETKIIEQHLKECKNVQEMFNLLSNTFDLRACEPGSIAKPMFISGIMKGIKLINPTLK
jgi:predicted anti-sigma-YlaC factor YlaD